MGTNLTYVFFNNMVTQIIRQFYKQIQNEIPRIEKANKFFFPFVMYLLYSLYNMHLYDGHANCCLEFCFTVPRRSSDLGFAISTNITLPSKN